MAETPARKSLTPDERETVYRKTRGRCHICGRKRPRDHWVADHVEPHRAGGRHHVDNYLVACPECNRLRWSYYPSQIRMILELGVYLHKEVKKKTELGQTVRAFYRTRKRKNQSRLSS